MNSNTACYYFFRRCLIFHLDFHIFNFVPSIKSLFYLDCYPPLQSTNQCKILLQFYHIPHSYPPPHHSLIYCYRYPVHQSSTSPKCENSPQNILPIPSQHSLINSIQITLDISSFVIFASYYLCDLHLSKHKSTVETEDEITSNKIPLHSKQQTHSTTNYKPILLLVLSSSVP